MPIRVEHGPNLAAVGKLAYRTGQYEYRNKRRAELERLAMQQAEMRLKAQMQQRQLAQQASIQQGQWGMDQQRIAAAFKQQQVGQQNAMGVLEQQQQWGILNQDVAHQRKLDLAEGVRNHAEMMADRNGQNFIDRIKLTQGLADESEMSRIQYRGLTENFGRLSMEGQQFVTKTWQGIQSMKDDERVPEDQKQQREEEMMQLIYGAWKNPLYTDLGERGIGHLTSLVSDDDGNTLVNRVRTGTGPDDYRNEWATTYRRDDGQEVPVTKEMRLAAERSVVEIDGFKFLQEYDLESNKYSYSPLKDENNELTKKELMDGYQKYLDGIDPLAEDTTRLEFSAWKDTMGFGEQVPQDEMINEIPDVLKGDIDAAAGGGIGGPGQMVGMGGPADMGGPQMGGMGGMPADMVREPAPGQGGMGMGPEGMAQPIQDRPREEVEAELAMGGLQELDAGGKPRNIHDQMGNEIPNGTQERPIAILNMAQVSEKMAQGELQPGQWIELPPRGMGEAKGPTMQLQEHHRGGQFMEKIEQFQVPNPAAGMGVLNDPGMQQFLAPNPR